MGASCVHAALHGIDGPRIAAPLRMTVHDVGVWFGVVVSALGILFALAKIGAYVLRSFHNEHVRPVFADISTSIQHNTDATANLTRALAETNETQREGQRKADATFDRLGQIIDDHEQRITALEPSKPAPAMRVRRKAS